MLGNAHVLFVCLSIFVIKMPKCKWYNHIRAVWMFRNEIYNVSKNLSVSDYFFRDQLEMKEKKDLKVTL